MFIVTKKQKKMSLESLNIGISIFVAAYPNRPKDQHKAAMYMFLTHVSQIIQHEDIPTWYKVHFLTRISPNMTRSRENLTHWLMSLNQFRLWFDAIDVLGEPKSWGPLIWNFLDTVAHLFVPHRAYFFRKIIELLPDIIPCPLCGEQMRILLTNRKWARNLKKCITKDKYMKYLENLRTYIKENHVPKN
jgi:hypothetical protein